MPPKAILSISSVEPFILDEGSDIINNIYKSWLVWIEELDINFLAAGVSDAPQKKAVLLHVSGGERRDIYKTLKQDDDTYETKCQKLTDYFRPRKNLTYVRFEFKQATKNIDKCVTSYITRLKNLALHCEFQNQNEKIKDTFLNRDTELELLDKVSKSKRKIEKRKERHQRKSKNICFKCGNKFTPGHLKNCSALGRKCDICGKLNHSVSACRGKEQDQVKYKNLKSKKVNKVENTTSDSENSSESSSESDCFVIFEKCNQNKIETNRVNSMDKTKSKSALIKINSKKISMLTDTGSTTTIIDKETFKKIQKRKANIQLRKSKMKLFPYGAEKPLEILGKFTTVLETNSK